jgi:hypothetical protein
MRAGGESLESSAANGDRRSPKQESARSQEEKSMPNPEPRRRSKTGWYLLLAVQFPLALWVGFYNSAEPSLAGIPFFYWFQLLLVLVCAALTAIVYFATERKP